MCGIFGYILNKNIQSGSAANAGHLLTRMSKKTSHRGPDDQGFWIHSLGSSFTPPVRDPSVIIGAPQIALGHRRLAIIDTSNAGWQPMVSKDRKIIVTYNGEIYNYIELRQQLIALGATFETQTDTEVLIEGYKVWGDGVFSKLIGMFALCLVDLNQDIAVIARDPFGIKPFHYAIVDGSFVFASEIKTLLEFPGIIRKGNRAVIQKYLETGDLDSDDRTFFESIKRFGAGGIAKISLSAPDKFLESKKFWQPSYVSRSKLSWNDAVDAVRAEFLRNVRLHLRSDVPIGAALSGGVDSSALVAAMRKIEPEADIRTFSYIADDAKITEEKWVDIVVSSQKAKPFKIHTNQTELLNDLDDLIATQDEPFGSTSIYAQYRVFKLAKESGVTVMLDGQGADEMFAGYRPYIVSRLSSLISSGDMLEAYRLLSAYKSIGGGEFATLSRAMVNLLPDSFRGAARAIYRRNPNKRKAWLKTHLPSSRSSRSAADGYLIGHLVESIASTSLPQLLRYEDRNSMRFSLESRVPFLTTGLVDLALSLPESFHVNSSQVSKAVFRAAMRGIVPDAILDRKDKIGFETPDAAWSQMMGNCLVEQLHNVTLPIIYEHLDSAKLLAQIHSRPNDFAKFEIWRLLNFVKWAERYDIT